VKIEVFSDVVCPWCAIGKRRLESALADFAHADQVEVVWRSYELDPGAPAQREGNLADLLAKKYGMTREQAQAANDRLTALAKVEGLEFHLDRARPGSTFDAHRLLHYAREVDPAMASALKERLLVAYFTEGQAISDPATLVRLCVEVGLDEQGSQAVLASDRYGQAVRADEREAFEFGVTGVPFFVVDGRFAIPGAQDASTITGVLERAWARSHP
jgi:predicted DsbA family dithiol-disulfide isomerase